MPLYSDPNYYYSGGSSNQLYSPYYTPGLYNSSTSSGGAYAPYSSTYSRSFNGTYIVPLSSPRSPTYTSSHSLSPRYQPKLSTITETSPLISSSRHSSLMPLTRIQSPKISCYTTPSSSSSLYPSKYIPPRPIPINTADIDVSSARHERRMEEEERKNQETATPSSSTWKPENQEEKENHNKEQSPKTEAQATTTSDDKRNAARYTIKRNRAVVRLSTIRSRSKDRSAQTAASPSNSTKTKEVTPEPEEKKFRDLPKPPEINLSWRQRLAEDLAAIPTYPIKKSPGDLIRERYLIQEVKGVDSVNVAKIVKTPVIPAVVAAELPIEEVLVEIDPLDKSIRRLSIPNCPTFHDICEDISSDKIDDDLNAGELRRRASIIQEQEQELLNQLQKSGSGTLQFIHLERRDSQDYLTDESSQHQSVNKRKSKKNKKVRHRITAIVEVENAHPLTPILQEKDEEIAALPKFTSKIETIEEHHEIHKIFKLPKKKSVKKPAKVVNETWPEGFVKATTPPKMKLSEPDNNKTYINTAEIFTFNRERIENIKNVQLSESKAQMPLIENLQQPMTAKLDTIKECETLNVENTCKTKFAKNTSIQEVLSSKGIYKSSGMLSNQTKPKVSPTSINKPLNEKTLSPASKSKSTAALNITTQKQFDKPRSLVEELNTTVHVATPKPIRKAIQKSDSGEDFWAQMGSRETLYMTTRKKALLENQWQLRESLLESQTTENVKNLKDIKSVVTEQMKEVLKKAESDYEMDDKNSTTRSRSNQSSLREKSSNEKAEIKEQLEQLKAITNIDVETKMNSAKATNLEIPEGPIQMKIETQKPKNAVLTQVMVAKKAQTSIITASTTTTKTTVTTKINVGQEAKSPEPHQQTTTISTTMTTTTTTTTTTATKSTTAAAAQISKTAEDTQKAFCRADAADAATKNISGELTTATTTSTSAKNVVHATAEYVTNAVAAVAHVTKTHVAAAAAAEQVAEIQTAAPVVTVKPTTNEPAVIHQEITVKIDQKSNNATKSPKSPKSPKSQKETTMKIDNKIKLPATKPKVNITKTANVSNVSTPVAKPKSAPINADQFIFAAPAKITPTTSPTQLNKSKMATLQAQTTPAEETTSLSTGSSSAVLTEKQQQNKTKVAAKITAATTTTIKTAETTKTTTIIPAIKATTTPTGTLKTATSSANTLMMTTTAATTAVAAAPTEAAAAAAAEAAIGTASTAESTATEMKTAAVPTFATNVATVTVADSVVAAAALISNNANTHVANNLSKFATVSDLAQCLHNVDADLDDYIPSSAENSAEDDDDDISDDSSFDYSSVNGCENLSESMKKKLKQRRKKEKQAEKARFDPQKKIKINPTNKCYAKEEAPRYPLVATPRPLWKREKIVYPSEDSEESDSDESGSTEETEESEECSTTSEEYEDDLNTNIGIQTGGAISSDPKDNSSIIRMSTCSNDSGFEGGTAPSSPKKMLETSYTYSQFQKSGRFTAPATVIPRFKNYTVDDFHFLAVLGKGSFGKVLLAELRDTTYYYAVKCLKKDVVLEDDDVDSTLIERKVLALGTKHPYLCHLFCTFQTESHLFFVMEYLNGGDLMFHIQESGRFSEERARFYGAEIISGLKFLHKKGIIYRDLKLDNVLLDYEGHVRIADFGMCKLQIYLDKTADSFCGTPDYMAPEIIKGEKYNQNVDWWSFGVLLYEMLIGQSPFSGCDEEELFWSICNEIPWFPVYISAEATHILKGLLEKDYTKRIGSQYSPAGEISENIFFRPIDWNLLEKRQLDPPFKPQVKHPLDTQYFDHVFTRERVRLTPIDKDILQSMDQKQFLGFTYTNPHITLD